MSPQPFYADADVTLFLGDMREVLPALDIAPDLVVADPPYQETSLAWDRWPDGWPGVVATVARSLWCFGSLRMFLARRDEFADWRLSQDVVWEKQNGSGFAGDRFRRVHEHVLHWYRDQWSNVHHRAPRVPYVGADPRYGRSGIKAADGRTVHTGSVGSYVWADDGTRLVKSVIRASNLWRRGGINPTEKPVELLRPLVEYGCPPGGLVLDPFAGSCSTGVAARLLGRRAVLIEVDEAMCEKAVQLRLAQGVLPLEVTR